MHARRIHMSGLEKHHWMHGIDEYLTRINHVHADKYKQIQKHIKRSNFP